MANRFICTVESSNMFYTLSLHDALPISSNKVWIATDRSRARRCVEACVYGTLDFVGYPKRKPQRSDRSEERFSRNAETDLVCRLLLEKKKPNLDRLAAEGARFTNWYGQA